MSFFHTGYLFLFLIYLVQTERVHFAKWIKMDSAQNVDIYNFETIFGQGLQNCIDTCKAKKQCKFINHHRRMSNICYLIGANTDENFQAEDYMETKSGYVFGEKREWNMAEYEECRECNERGACRTVDEKKYSICQSSGCGPPIQNGNTIYLGNMFSVWKSVRFKCVDGYRNNRTDSAVSTCTENGTWSTTNVRCLPEYAFGNDVFEFNNTFYKLLREKQVWTAAQQSCDELRGHLIHIKSQEEQDFIVNGITGIGDFNCHWIGGRKVNGKLTWLDGTLVTNGYTNFNMGQPDDYDGVENCLQLVYYYREYFKWNDIACSSPCWVICELR